MTPVAWDSIWRLSGLLVVLMVTVGCVPLRDVHEAAVLKYLAETAYWKTGVKDSRHYHHGWKQGYAAAASGGSTNPPPVAPRRYWGPKWQNPNGRRCVNDWYRGYADGASVAAMQAPCCFDYVPHLAEITMGDGTPDPMSDFELPLEHIPIPTEEPIPAASPPEPNSDVQAASFQLPMPERLPPVTEDLRGP